MARRPPGPDARRRDLALDKMVAEAVPLGVEPATDDELQALVRKARDADGAPDWLRGIGRDRLAGEFAALSAAYGPLLHPTHGADIAARLLARAPRELPEPGGATLLGCFATDSGPITLAGLTVRRDGPSLVVEDAVEEHPLSPAARHDASVDSVERAAAGKLASLAARHRLRPISPATTAVVVLAAGPDPDERLTAAALVAGVHAAALILPDSSDTKAVNTFEAAALNGAPGALLVWDPGTGRLGWLWKWATEKKLQLLVVHGVDAEQAADEVFAALLPLARTAKFDADAQPGGLETVTVALDKVGSRGAALGDDLRITTRYCRHKSRKRLDGGAEAKIKGAKNVIGLPEGSIFRTLYMCSDMGCTLCWATYRIPCGSGWPPSA